ncbi:MAG: hypothetical protein AAGA56_20745 [Myxococcota bacterium]
MTEEKGERQRGLPSVSQARADRRRMHWLPPRVWLWALVCIGTGIVIWWRVEQGEVDDIRAELLARQRTVVAELGPRWFPLRDKLEAWTAECGQGSFEEQLGDEARTWKFRSLPGIYLRLAQSSTESADKIRAAANKSLKDGFTSCLTTAPNANPLKGKECRTTRECERGLICNEFSRCAAPSQPYNLRTAYKTLEVMGEAWVAEIQETTQKLTMRGAQATFADISTYDLPIATDLLQRSKYFLVVVDEPAPGGLVAGDDEFSTTDDRSIATEPHPARVCLWRLEDDSSVFKLRVQGGTELRGPVVENETTRNAQQRQAIACSFALEVRDRLGLDGTMKTPAIAPSGSGAPPPADRAAPSATATGVPALPAPL